MTKLTDHVFKTFPEFSKLTLKDKGRYDDLIALYPPIYDISFAALMTWWNPLDSISISLLNGNLVIQYWLPGEEEHSGLALVGTERVDESLCSVFDYLKDKDLPPKLVNVPEFVLSHIKYPDLFIIDEERRYSEYIIPITRYYPLVNMSVYKRWKVERSLKKIGEERIVVRSLDLHSEENRKRLQSAADEWQTSSINSYGEVEKDAIRDSLKHADLLGQDNLCLFVDNQLYGFCLYEIPRNDKRYVIIKHVKATHKDALRFELIAYQFAKWFSEQGVMYANINADFGMLPLRVFMLTLGPTNFFRKYTVRPVI